MLARLVPSLTGRPFTSLAASRSPTASGRATMCSTTRTRAKNTTPSFGRWLTNGFASCISAGRSAPRTTRTYTWRYSKNGAQFSPPCTCKQNDKNYGREGSGDYPEALEPADSQEIGPQSRPGGLPKAPLKPSHRGLGNPRCAGSGYVTEFVTWTTKATPGPIRSGRRKRCGGKVLVEQQLHVG